MPEPDRTHEWFGLRGTCRWFGRQPGVQNVDLSVHSGDRVGFVGPNGSGKTTLIKLLSGHVPPTAGELERRAPDPENQSLNRHLGYSGHELMVYEQLTCAENLDFFADLYDQNDRRTRIDRLLDELNLQDRRDARVRELSSGMKKKLSIARALVHRPAVLLLDEPFRGVDAASTAQITTRLQQFIDDGGTLLLASHDLSKVYELCERVLILADTVPRSEEDLNGQTEKAFRNQYRQVTQMNHAD